MNEPQSEGIVYKGGKRKAPSHIKALNARRRLEKAMKAPTNPPQKASKDAPSDPPKATPETPPPQPQPQTTPPLPNPPRRRETRSSKPSPKPLWQPNRTPLVPLELLDNEQQRRLGPREALRAAQEGARVAQEAKRAAEADAEATREAAGKARDAAREKDAKAAHNIRRLEGENEYLKEWVNSVTSKLENEQGLRISYQKQLYSTNRKAARAAATFKKLEGEAESLRKELRRSRAAAKRSLHEIQVSHERSTRELNIEIRQLRRSAALIDQTVRPQLERYKQEVRLLRLKVLRAPGVAKRNVARALKATQKSSMTMPDGSYSPQARDLIRQVRAAGVPARAVGAVVKAVAGLFGVECPRIPSRRTVQRCVLEGGIAAEIQLIWEMLSTEGWTYSCDGTTHRSINYESRTIRLLPTDNDDDSTTTSHVVRSLGVRSSDSHTAASQHQGMINVLDDCLTTYNSFQSDHGNQLSTLGVLFLLLYGMNSDHAADQKALAELIKASKHDFWLQELGRRAIAAKGEADRLAVVQEVNEAKLVLAGGFDAWNLLAEEKQDELNIQAHEAFIAQLGHEEYLRLTDEQKNAIGIDLFVWAGCAMHKELNCFKGLAAAFSPSWIRHGLTPPRLLMNLGNHGAVNFAANGEGSSTEAGRRAVENSEGGGVKLVSLLGALLNHKDDKKGEQDNARIFFLEQIGILLMFPDVSNTRYGTYGEGAGVTLVHRERFIEYLGIVRDRKVNPGLNHMEQNIWDGLHDTPTLTELAVLALYSQSVGQPYMAYMRSSSSINILDTGEYHEKLKTHIRAIIANPDLLLGSDASHKSGCLDGRHWNQSDVISAVHELAPSLPHLRDLLVDSLTEALVSWERFTAEFASGGLIASLTDEQRRKASMSTTNDVNEGALGEMRVESRDAPNMTQNQRVSMKMWTTNNTLRWTKKHWRAKEHSWVMKKARERDAKGLEKERLRALRAADVLKVKMNRMKIAKKAEKRAAQAQKLAELTSSTVLEMDEAVAGRLKGAELQNQFVVWAQLDSAVPRPSKLNADQKRAELVKAIQRCKANQATGEVAGGGLSPGEQEGMEGLSGADSLGE